MAPTTPKFAFGNGEFALGGQPRIVRIGAQALLHAPKCSVHGELLKIAGRNCPSPPGHGATQAIRGRRRSEAANVVARAALDGENVRPKVA